MTRELTTIANGFCFLEAPRWHADRLWFSDIFDHKVYSVAADGSGRRVEARTPGHPCGIDFDNDGRLLIVLMQEREVLVRQSTGELRSLARLEGVPGPLNDLTVGPNGNLYIGAVGFDPSSGDPIRTGSLVRVSPNGEIATVAEDLWYPNGIAIANDETLIMAESFGNRISSFTIEPDGRLTARRTFARFGPEPRTSAVADALAELVVTPDGCCLDAEDGLWVADAIHNRALRVTERDGITDTIDIDAGVFACMLGGGDGHTLYLCVAPDADPTARLAGRQARLLAVCVDAPRAGRP